MQRPHLSLLEVVEDVLGVDRRLVGVVLVLLVDVLEVWRFFQADRCNLNRRMSTLHALDLFV